MNSKRIKQLRHFAPHLERFTLAEKVLSLICIIVIAIGLYALYLQVRFGHSITGMRDNVVWGIYIVNFIFFIGISYAGAVISGIFHILNVPWRRPIIRIAELITVIAVFIGPIYILLCIGRLDRLHYLFIYPRLASPIVWDVIAIITYLTGACLFVYLATVKDISLLREFKELKVAPWRKRMYKVLSMGYKNTDSQRKTLDSSIMITAVLIVPIAIVVSSVLSWIFGMTLRPGWHSTIFGPYFVLGAIYSGTGVLIIAMWVFRKAYGLQEYITDKHFKYIGLILMALAAGYGYFTFSEYLTDWYTSEEWTASLLEKMFDMDQYGKLFWLSNVGGILLPIIVIGVPFLRSVNSITAVSVIMVFSLWIKRFLIIVPSLENTLIPMQDLRPEYVQYQITWVEWALTFTGFAAFILMFLLASKFAPIIPVFERTEEKQAEDSKISHIKTAEA